MTLVTRLLPAAFIFASLSGAARADSAPLPPKGAATFAIYFTGRVLGAHDIGEAGSTIVSEASGLAKSIDGPKTFDNMVEQCLIHAETVGKSVKFTGSCLNTDADGDKYFHTFEGGPESGKSTIIAGDREIQRHDGRFDIHDDCGTITGSGPILVHGGG
jgi:hypothetical protein